MKTTLDYNAHKATIADRVTHNTIKTSMILNPQKTAAVVTVTQSLGQIKVQRKQQLWKEAP